MKIICAPKKLAPCIDLSLPVRPEGSLNAMKANLKGLCIFFYENIILYFKKTLQVRPLFVRTTFRANGKGINLNLLWQALQDKQRMNNNFFYRRLLLLGLLGVITSSLFPMQSSFNNDFNVRFGPDSHIYNTPLYFGCLTIKKERIKKDKKYTKKTIRKKIKISD